MIPLRVPPHSILAEQAVLGFLLADPDNFVSHSIDISIDSFYRSDHQLVFRQMLELTASGSWDRRALWMKLESLKADVPISYIEELNDCAPLGYNYALHKDALLDFEHKRRLLRIAQTIESDITNPSVTTEALTSGILVELDNPRSANTASTWEEASLALMAEINDPSGMSLGFESIDKELQGLRRTALMVVPAGTGIGKTTFALNLAIQQALLGRPVLYVSLEMPAADLVCKMVPMISDISYASMFYPSDAEKLRISSVLAQSKNMPIFFETSTSNVEAILAAALAHKQRNGIEMLIVDHLNLLGVEYEDLAHATRSFKLFADKHRIPVVLLCQLNNHYQQRAEKDPLESDLRGSGTIAQDADVILALYKLSKDLPETYMKLMKNRKAMTNIAKYFDIYYEAPSCTYLIGAEREKPLVPSKRKSGENDSTDY